MLDDAAGKSKPKKARPDPMYRKIIPEVARLKAENPKITIRQITATMGTTNYATVQQAWTVYKQESEVNNIGYDFFMFTPY